MATDQEIRDAGFKYVPQQKYLLNPFELPEDKEPVTNSGIVATNAFTNMGEGSGGALQVGDPMMNFDNYYNYTGNKYMMNQDRPNLDSYSDNAQKTFLNMPSYRQQELTGPDMGEYIASGTNIPLEQTMAGNIQSKIEGAKGGIKNLIGMIPSPSNLLNRIGIQNFSSLSPADQLFIKTNTGYRGPTVFGENTGGGNVDPFGMNVESLFGNYAQGVRDNFSQLQDTLKNKDRGAVTFNEVTGMFEGEDADDANKQTKLIRQKFLFRKKQTDQQAKNQRDIEKQAGVRDTKAAQDFMRNNPNYGDAGANINPGSGGGSGYDPGADYSGSDKRSQDNRSSDLGFSDIRLKENVELIGKSPSNINIYKFNYKDSPTTYQGAMAHEVPWASVKHSNGYMMVDYNKIDVNFKKI